MVEYTYNLFKLFLRRDTRLGLIKCYSTKYSPPVIPLAQKIKTTCQIRLTDFIRFYFSIQNVSLTFQKDFGSRVDIFDRIF